VGVRLDGVDRRPELLRRVGGWVQRPRLAAVRPAGRGEARCLLHVLRATEPRPTPSSVL